VLNDTVTLDTITPEIKIESPIDSKEYLNDQMLNVDYLVSDNVSEVKNIKTNVQYDGKDLRNDKIDLSLEKLGQHTILITAQDEAGNASEETINFKIIADIDSIAKNIDHYFELGLIKDLETRDFLKSKVSELAHAQDMIAKLDGKNNSKPKENQLKLFNKKIEIMIENLNYVKIKIN
jgi:hypothetical protein